MSVRCCKDHIMNLVKTKFILLGMMFPLPYYCNLSQNKNLETQNCAHI